MRKLRHFLRGRLLIIALLCLLAAAACALLAAKLPALLAPAALMERALSFAAAVTVLVLPDLPERKTAKLVLLCFLPWVGFVLVFVFTEAPKRSYPPAPLREKDGLLSRVSCLAEGFCGTHARGGHIIYLPSGEEMREKLLSDLKGAKRRIYLEYYIIAEGKFWGGIQPLLEEKAKHGVDVRIIFDDFGCSLTLPRSFAKQLKRRGIGVRIFRRLKFARGLTRRDHRKLFLIDDVCYVGGINLADEYVGEIVRFGHWKDSAVRIEGDVTDFERVFLRTWYGRSFSEEQISPSKEQGADANFSVIFDGTEEGVRAGATLLPLLMLSAKRTLFLSSPYLSLPHSVMELFAAAVSSGVDVRILIPHIPDKKPVFFLTRAYARELQRMGVKVREYTPGFLHAKAVCIDGECAFVSSYNLDFRSLFVQAECGVFFADMDAASALESDFLAAFEAGEEVKRANAFVRFWGRLAMLFAPLT